MDEKKRIQKAEEKALERLDYILNSYSAPDFVKIIGYFPCDCINIQTVAVYEMFGFRGEVKALVVNISAKRPFSGMHFLDSTELEDDVFMYYSFLPELGRYWRKSEINSFASVLLPLFSTR